MTTLKESYFLTSNESSGEVILVPPYSSMFCNPGGRYWNNEGMTSEHFIVGDPLVDGSFIGQYEEFLVRFEMGESRRVR